MGPFLRALPALFLLVSLTVLSGCVEDEEAPGAILKVSHRIGDDLYSWGEHEFTNPFGVGGSRRIKADFDVPDDVARVGVGFRGNFVWPENSTALFEVFDQADRRVVLLNASAGREDDHGPIGTFWQFRQVRELAPGPYRLVATGTGYVGHLEFQLHGIPRATTSINETFEVQEEGPVELEVFVQGWGRTPTVMLTAPDGTTTDLGVLSADHQAKKTIQATPGTYRLDADTTQWGGRFAAQALA